LISGVLAPGSKQNYGGTNFFQHLHLTDLGRKAIENRACDPLYPNDYLNELNSTLMDETSKVYLLESLRTFNLNCYFGTVALLGMCVELIFINYVGIIKKYIEFEISESINVSFKNLLEALIPFKNELPEILGQNIELWLSEFQSYMRLTRNESYKPVINEFSQEEVYGLLLKFPSLIKKLISLLEYFKEKKQS